MLHFLHYPVMINESKEKFRTVFCCFSVIKRHYCGIIIFFQFSYEINLLRNTHIKLFNYLYVKWHQLVKWTVKMNCHLVISNMPHANVDSIIPDSVHVQTYSIICHWFMLVYKSDYIWRVDFVLFICFCHITLMRGSIVSRILQTSRKVYLFSSVPKLNISSSSNYSKVWKWL